MLRLYDYLESGNGYKVRLLLAQLGRPYELVEIDILKGESRTAEFLARNPVGKIPVLELDDGTCLAESNAVGHEDRVLFPLVCIVEGVDPLARVESGVVDGILNLRVQLVVIGDVIATYVETPPQVVTL